MTDDEPCRCWANTHALGHDGHCCFTQAGKWRDDEAVCHVPTEYAKEDQ